MKYNEKSLTSQQLKELQEQILRAKSAEHIGKIFKEKFLRGGYSLKSSLLKPGDKLYRIVPVDEAPKIIKRISYPPNPPKGRCNKEDKPVFYCCDNPTAPFYEAKDLKVGDFFVIGEWEFQESIFVIPIGHSKKSLSRLLSNRLLDLNVKSQPFHNKNFNPKTNRQRYEFLCKIFTEKTAKYYTQTIAISEMLMYPTNEIQEIAKQEIGDFYPNVGITYS